MRLHLIILILCLFTETGFAQRTVTGEVRDLISGTALGGAEVRTRDAVSRVITDEKGRFHILLAMGVDSIQVSAVGYSALTAGVNSSGKLILRLTPIEKEMDAVVVSGTLRPMHKLESPVAVEVYNSNFFKKNPAPSLFESMQQVNGVRPQLNCSVCNTGDIHINGLEGPYTMVTIDGMPIVSSLGSVYGLFGIPTQLIDRVEIVKGPASGLYGPEAIGGLINVITKEPAKAPRVSVNAITSSWLEHNLDLGFKINAGKKSTLLMGVDYFNFNHKADHNKDGFTDVALQHRISLFQKWTFHRRHQRQASIAARYFYEDRWGGEMNWTPKFRGTDLSYGESIYTNRWELMGRYQLPVSEKLFMSFSATSHRQNSWYGTIPYMGDQRILFGQLIWDKAIGVSHNLIAGAALRHNYYDDNSTATVDTLTGKNKAEKAWVPGLFVQDEWAVNDRHTLLFGARVDHHPVHGEVFTPRFAWKWKTGKGQVLRLNAGTGFRVVSLFTEDHAALTGARVVEIRGKLQPEKSYNVNLNYSTSFKFGKHSIQTDASSWYSHFRNQIIADYDMDPNKIVYQNLDGYSRSTGLSVNVDYNFAHRFRVMTGFTWQDVRKTTYDAQHEKINTRQMLTERWSGVWQIGYSFLSQGITIDYTGNIYGPMRLPLLSLWDPRPAYSPVWSIQNLQVTKRFSPSFECFVGIKNLLNWTPARGIPFLIARTNDPFDKQVTYDANGQVARTPDNPYGLSFDPSYIYAPNQGRRGSVGLRWSRK
ncbi:MAG: TonB-dependent receptor [Chitinophagaceae bacterium]|nr:TonB-dependent receptor [Chitinophagaceae bacterium]